KFFSSNINKTQCPVNAADLPTPSISARHLQPTPRTHQPAACGAAALVVAPYRPHQTKLSTTNHNFFQKFFPQASKKKSRSKRPYI
ncbi:hypothetical protein, partial [Brucella intermedia]|uniref:hypothetical protein n=1 Tax=Brucella intermedia TaxID=94625 RepID=UPI001AEE3046